MLKRILLLFTVFVFFFTSLSFTVEKGADSPANAVKFIYNAYKTLRFGDVINYTVGKELDKLELCHNIIAGKARGRTQSEQNYYVKLKDKLTKDSKNLKSMSIEAVEIADEDGLIAAVVVNWKLAHNYYGKKMFKIRKIGYWVVKENGGWKVAESSFMAEDIVRNGY